MPFLKVARLEALDAAGLLVALIGENNNVLGIGTVEDVNAGTALIELSLPVLGVIPEFFVDLCCVCSIVNVPAGGTIGELVALLERLGIDITDLLPAA